MITAKRFTAGWCAPCRMLAPIWNTLSAELPDVKFETIDIDRDEESVKLYGIRSVPMVILLKDGEVMDTLVGVQSKQRYMDAINDIHKP